MSRRIAVLGTGYLGVTHAACMAELGFDVLGMDVDPVKVAALSVGEVPFFEPDLAPLVAKHTETGKLRFTTSYAEVAEFADVLFTCVGTPQKRGELAADLSQVNGVIEGLAPHLRRPCLVVGKSTVPVGTAERLSAYLAEHAPAGAAAELAWNPEFLREGFAVADTLRPDRLVVGTRSEAAVEILREVYAELLAAGVPLLVTDFPTAELVKVAANAFLATKISFINAMAEVCEAAGADVTALADAIGHDPRIGRRFLNAGLGFGGGCLPKDIRAFMARAGELGAAEALTFLREVDAINMRRRSRTVDLARELCGGSVVGRRIAVLGAAFKPDSDDVRDSPALHVAGEIHLQGGLVSVYDPKAMENAAERFPTLTFAPTALAACAGADLVLHLTEWQEFRALDPALLAGVVTRPVVLDARNALDADAWRAAGWTFRGFGRP
ncbi:MAG: UDP-glucose dehydrogenase family protein [Sporichthyaceae bacterium]